MYVGAGHLSPEEELEAAEAHDKELKIDVLQPYVDLGKPYKPFS
jgi:hypothetical protein